MTVETAALTKVVAEFPAHPGEVSREAMWARQVEETLFELRNTPWFSYGLAWGDVVRCEEDELGVPIVQEVVTPSGHRTLRLIFNDEVVTAGAQRDVLARVGELGASAERATGSFLSVDVSPEADYEAIAAYLRDEVGRERVFCEEAWRGFEELGDETPAWLGDDSDD